RQPSDGRTGGHRTTHTHPDQVINTSRTAGEAHSHAMRDLIDARDWLTVFILPAYAPELNAVEYLWAHVKRSLANLANVALDQLEAVVRNRLSDCSTAPTSSTASSPGPDSPSTSHRHHLERRGQYRRRKNVQPDWTVQTDEITVEP
ncbi:transposase, partial [Kitasatospora sp. NPDC101155]|uniref:transposase n=1 Tax=Kitasatospora sp. NPDC101155 TaxID=3364097 RepID=UPI0038232C9B